jgi:hypothetical protein
MRLRLTVGQPALIENAPRPRLASDVEAARVEQTAHRTFCGYVRRAGATACVLRMQHGGTRVDAEVRRGTQALKREGAARSERAQRMEPRAPMARGY